MCVSSEFILVFINLVLVPILYFLADLIVCGKVSLSWIGVTFSLVLWSLAIYVLCVELEL